MLIKLTTGQRRQLSKRAFRRIATLSGDSFASNEEPWHDHKSELFGEISEEARSDCSILSSRR